MLIQQKLVPVRGTTSTPKCYINFIKMKTNVSLCTQMYAPIEKKMLLYKLHLQTSSVWDSQSAADASLALFSSMNKWQGVLFLKCELSKLLHVSNRLSSLHYKQNNTRLLGDMEFLFSCSTQYLTSEITNWKLHCIHPWNISSTLWFHGVTAEYPATSKL